MLKLNVNQNWSIRSHTPEIVDIYFKNGIWWTVTALQALCTILFFYRYDTFEICDKIQDDNTDKNTKI